MQVSCTSRKEPPTVEIFLVALVIKVLRPKWLEHPDTKKPFVSIFYAWNTARKKAGLPDLRIQDLRHSFASFLINGGRSQYEIQKILGHTQVKTIQRYAHFSQDSLISAANTASNVIPLSMMMPKTVSKVQLLAAKAGQGKLEP